MNTLANSEDPDEIQQHNHNSEDPDEMQQNAAIHQGLHCLLRLGFGTEIHHNF